MSPSKRQMLRLTLPPEGVAAASSHPQESGMEPSSKSRSDPSLGQASLPGTGRLLLLCFPFGRRGGGGAGGGDTTKMATSRGGPLPNSRSDSLALSPAGSSKQRDLLSVQLEVRLEGGNGAAERLSTVAKGAVVCMLSSAAAHAGG